MREPVDVVGRVSMTASPERETLTPSSDLEWRRKSSEWGGRMYPS